MSADVAGWIAVGAAVGAAVALLLAVAFYLKLRRVRQAQMVLLGGGRDDLVDFAVSLQGRIDDLPQSADVSKRQDWRKVSVFEGLVPDERIAAAGRNGGSSGGDTGM